MIIFEKDHPHRSGLDYVVRVIDKKHLNEVYHYLKSDGFRIFATDGHNLYFYVPEISPLVAGLYKIVENTKKTLGVELVETDLEYPDVDRALPKLSPTHEFTKNSSVGMKLAEVIRAMSGGALHIDLFKNAVAHPDITHFLPSDGYSPVVFQGGNLTAVVMPLRA